MGDRVARFEIGIGGDDADVRSILAGLKAQFRSAVADLEATANKVKLFEGLQDKTKAAADALAEATNKAAALAVELEKVQKSGGKGVDEFTKSLKEANKEVAIAQREFNKSVDSISKLQSQLSRAGVDTKNLAAEQTRLAAASRAASDAAANQAAQQLLGLKTTKDVNKEIQQLNVAYNTLSKSGTLSAKELGAAQQLLKDKTAELRASVSGVAETAKAGAPDILGFFTGTLLPAAGLTLSIGTVVKGLLSVVAAGREVKQATAEIGAVSNLTREQLATLEQGAKDLADRIGTDVVGSLKTLKEIIRSTGAAPDDALAILAASAETAKGSVSDLNVVAKVAADLISAYGLQASETKGVLDGLFAGMKAGGPTFADLNGQIGGLAVAAKGVGVDVTSLTAFLNVMTSASGDASGSVNALQRILLSFNTETTRQKLADLGIVAKDFTGVMLELAEKGIPITRLIDLGIAGTKAAVGVTALTRSAEDLTAAFERQKTAAEQGAVALQKYLDSPQGRADAFAAAWEKVKLSLSRVFGEGSFLQAGATRALADIDALINIFHTLTPEEQAAAVAAENVRLGFVGVADAAKISAAETLAAARAMEENTKQSHALAATLGDLSTKLLGNAAAMQDAAVKAVAAATASADAQIAALSRAPDVAAETARKTIDIQLTASDKILAIITESQAKITRATEEGIVARQARMRDDGEKQKEIDAEGVKLRLASLEKIQKLWQDHYKTLQEQAQANLATVRSIELQRVGFAQQLEQAVAQARGAALDASFGDYLERQRRINTLITAARKEALEGDLSVAKNYSDQAIAEIARLAPAYSANGTLVVSSLNAQTDKLGALKRLDTEYGAALQSRGEAAKTGADATIAQIERVKKPLKEATDLVDNLNRQAAKGLDISVQLKGVQKATAELDALTKDRTVNVIVNMIKGEALQTETQPQLQTGLVTGAPFTPFAAGGPVTPSGLFQAVRKFASGGSVFLRPSWLKVPGSGDGDTVPAALSEGSFVVRKSASQKYGDGVMSRLARAFAGGGTVGTIGDIATRILGSSNPSGLSLGGGGQSEAQQVIAYALEVLGRFARTGNGRYMIARIAPLMRALIERLSRNPGDQGALDELLKDAESIGMNLHLVDFVERSTSPGGFATADLSFADFKSGTIPDRQRRPFGDETANGLALALGLGADTSSSGPSSSFGSWFTKVVAPVFGRQPFDPNKQGNLFRFAGGGGVGDIVPAMLTPGEYVLNPKAVASVSKLFGGGFLHALNSMRIPSGFFDRALNIAPPQRPLGFAAGGPVPGAQSFASGGAVRGGGGFTINIYPQRLDEAEVKRSVIPAIDKLMRRSK